MGVYLFRYKHIINRFYSLYIFYSLLYPVLWKGTVSAYCTFPYCTFAYCNFHTRKLGIITVFYAVIKIRRWNFSLKKLLSGNALRKKCPYSELFWSLFSRIWTKCEEIRSISPYSVRTGENADQNNSKYGHFSRNDLFIYLIIYLFNTLFTVD